ncbi:MAG: PHP domain-containing protein [Candidatus Micrarchaeota archaeon]
MIDLHAHTTASDGTLGFDELVTEAARAGLRAIAITDHDNVCSAGLITGNEPLEVIAGVELSVFDRERGYMDVHVLGLFIDPKHKTLNSKLDTLQAEREAQKRETVEKLRELGYEITFEEVKAEAKGVAGRPHIARVLLRKYPKEFASLASVFDKLLGRGKPAYIEREAGFSLSEAVRLVHGAGGLAVLAHPFVYPYDAEKLLRDFKGAGGDGVETYYDYIKNRPEVKTTKTQNSKLTTLARKLAAGCGLLESGGSDFHGANKGQELGQFGAPDWILDRLKKAL